MRYRRIFPYHLSLALILVILLAACGSQATPNPAPEPTEAMVPTVAPETVVEPETTAEPAPAEGISENVGVVAYPGDLPDLDPAYMLSGDTNIGFNVYDTLTRWDPENGVTPVLATSWESNEDGTEWTFHLREGVVCHDGSAFTAEDVKASLDRNIEAGMVAYDFIGVDLIEVVDDHTVRFVASAPRNLPLILSAQYGMFIYTAEAAQQSSEWFAEGNDAGCGPYMIESIEPGARVVLTRFEDYYGGWEEGQFTKAIFEIVEDPTVRDQMIRSGEADITADLALDSIESIQATEGVTVLTVVPLAHLAAAFDLSNPPLDNLQVRQALAYSFPYQDVYQGVFQGYGSIGVGFGPSSLWDPPADFPRYTLDPEKAKALLDEAGFTDGFELNLGLPTGSKETLEAVNLWQAELARLGITLNIQQLSSGAFWDYVFNPDNEELDVIMVAASGDVPSPYAWLICYTSSELGWMPFVGYNNPEFDQLVFDAWAAEASNSSEAHDLWVQAQLILHDDAASVFVMDTPVAFAYGNDLKGFQPNPAASDIVFWYELRRQ